MPWLVVVGGFGFESTIDGKFWWAARRGLAGARCDKRPRFFSNKNTYLLIKDTIKN